MNARRCTPWLAGLVAFAAAVASAQTPATPPAAKSGTDAKAQPAVSVAVNPPPADTAKVDEEKTAPAGTKAPAPVVNKFRMPPPIRRGSSAPVPIPPRFLQVRARIDALFAQRNSPPPKPDERNNPFRPPGAYVAAEPVASPEGVVVPVSGNRDVSLLQRAVATLNVKGKVQRGSILQLVINSGPGKDGTYKAGDVINVNLNSDAIPLRVHEITRNSVTFRLNEAEMTLKL